MGYYTRKETIKKNNLIKLNEQLEQKLRSYKPRKLFKKYCDLQKIDCNYLDAFNADCWDHMTVNEWLERHGVQATAKEIYNYYNDPERLQEFND